MPQYQNWLQHIPLGNPEHRERDRKRKHRSGTAESRRTSALATYHRIDKCVYRKISLDGYVVQHYRLSDLANIYGITPATVRRWYRSRMLPELFGGGNTYIKPQILIICATLNDIFEQGVRHYRKSHIVHAAMMEAGNEMVLRRFALKLARGPKQPVRILPHPSKWARLAELRKKRVHHTSYRPTVEDTLRDPSIRF